MKKKRWKMPFPVVFIDWVDATTLGGWTDKSGANELLDDTRKLCHSVAFLVREDKKGLVICQSLDGNNNPCNLICIPGEALKRVRRIPVVGHSC